MITNFSIKQAVTVPSDYSWDKGVPLTTTATLTNAFTTQTYVSGYAPGVDVLFENNSVSDSNFRLSNYDWDFGDYYHDTNNNISLSCTNLVKHLYIMPGVYTVTLRHTQSRTKTLLETNPFLCRGKYDIRWFWDELLQEKETRRTWNDTACMLLSGVQRWTPKWWDNETDCFEKYCKFWSWYNLKDAPGSANPVIWNDTGSNDSFEKKWMYQANETQCSNKDVTYLDTIEIIDGLAVKIGVVEVKEIPPTAGITNFTRPLTGSIPYTIQLSPSACKPGSFPIDRIDWDLGDGTPIKTVTRFTDNLNDPGLVYSDRFLSDPLDVRNFDVVHTYSRSTNTYAVFYPSLTCYSANTSTSDSCCTTVGPLFFKESPKVQLFKTRNTLKGNIYALDIDKNVAFLTDTLQDSAHTQQILNTPPTRLKDFINNNEVYILGDRGFQGFGWPPPYTPSCEDAISVTTLTAPLATEDNNPEIVDTDSNINELGLQITTEGGLPISI